MNLFLNSAVLFKREYILIQLSLSDSIRIERNIRNTFFFFFFLRELFPYRSLFFLISPYHSNLKASIRFIKPRGLVTRCLGRSLVVDVSAVCTRDWIESRLVSWKRKMEKKKKWRNWDTTTQRTASLQRHSGRGMKC